MVWANSAGKQMLKHSLICFQKHCSPVGMASQVVLEAAQCPTPRKSIQNQDHHFLLGVFLPIPSRATLLFCCEFMQRSVWLRQQWHKGSRNSMIWSLQPDGAATLRPEGWMGTGHGGRVPWEACATWRTLILLTCRGLSCHPAPLAAAALLFSAVSVPGRKSPRRQEVDY